MKNGLVNRQLHDRLSHSNLLRLFPYALRLIPLYWLDEKFRSRFLIKTRFAISLNRSEHHCNFDVYNCEICVESNFNGILDLKFLLLS